MRDLTLKLKIDADGNAAIVALDRVQKETKDLGDESERTSRKAKSAIAEQNKAVGDLGNAWQGVRGFAIGAIGAIAGIGGLSQIVGSITRNTVESEQALAQVEARIRSTGGAAGLTSQQLQAMAQQLQDASTFDDDAIMQSQSVLLSFTNVVGDQFGRAQQAILDLSVAMKTDLQSATVQVGKALNEPAQALTALQRSGIQFSDAQEDMIKQLVDTGQTAAAQGLILDELERQFGGSAKAARDTFGGALDALRVTIGNLLEADGGLGGLAGAINAANERLKDPQVAAAIQTVVQLVIGAIPPIVSGMVTIVENLDTIGAVIGTVTPLVIAYFAAWSIGPALYAAIAAKATVATGALTALNVPLAAAIGSLGLLKTAVLVVGAAFAGWQIGTWAREKFLAVELAGIYLVRSLMLAWENIKSSSKIVWESVKAGAIGAINIVRTRIADLIDSFAGLSDVEIFGTRLIGGAVDNMRALAAAIRPTKSAYAGLREEISRINRTRMEESNAIADTFDAMVSDAYARDSAAEAAAKQAEEAAKLPPLLEATIPALEDTAAATRAAAEAAEQGADAYREFASAQAGLDRILRDQAEQLGGPSVRAANDYADALADIEAEQRGLMAIGPLTLADQARIDQARQNAAVIHRNALGQIVAREGGFVNESRGYADEYQRTWQSGIDSVSSAFSAWLTGGIRSFKDFGRALKDIALRAIGDVIQIFTRNQLGRLFAGSAGGAGLFSSAANAATAGRGGGYGMWATPTGMAPGAGGPGLGFLGSAIAPWAFIGGGALLGARGAGSTGGRIAGAITGGALGLGAFGFASQAAGALGAGAGLLGAGGALSAGLAGASAALGPIGIALAAAALVNRLAGGRLFGTSWKPTGVSGTELAFGASGVSGNTFVEESRRRSLFRGTQRRTVRGAIDGETERNIDEAFAASAEAIAAGARALAVTSIPVIESAWKQVTDANGRVISETTTILGRTFEESLEASMQRRTAEGLIAVIDQSLGNAAAAAGQVVGQQIIDGAGAGVERGIGDIGGVLAKAGEAVAESASAVAERWRDDAATLLDGAQFLLAAVGDIRAGVGLLGGADSLGALADLIEDLQAPGESLVATYQRVSGATRLLDQALGMSGVSLDQAREEVVRFAAGIADAAGGLDAAAMLWNRYFDVAFSAEERLTAAIAQAQQAATGALGTAGLDPTAGIADIRSAINAALAEGASPERVVNLLRAADAVGRLNELYSQQAAAIDQTTAAIEEERLAREAALAEGRAAYAALASDLQRAVAEMGASELVMALGEIRRAERERIAALNEAARAAGLQTAREEDLARAHLLAADAAARAIARANAAAQSIIDDLYGTPLEQLEAQIAAIQGASGTGGFGGIAAGAAEVGDAWGAVIDRIRASLDEVARGPLGGLRPRDQLAEIQRQFNAAIAAARGGDASAAGRANDLLGDLLRAGQRVFASSDAYQRLLADSRAALQSLLGMGGSAIGGGGGPGATVGTMGGLGAPNETLAELLRQRDELLAAQEAERRREQAERLAEYVREITQVTGEGALDYLRQRGVDLERFAADLGVDLDNLTVETTGALAAIANRLAIELPELAAGLGVDLGRLADANSLINDALEAVIARQPPEIADALAPLLARVEAAVSPEEQLAALAALEQYIDQLAPAMRLALAPFFDSIDPAAVDDQIAILSGQRDIAADSLLVFQSLEEISREHLDVAQMLGVDQLIETRRTTSAVDRAAEAQQAGFNAVRDAIDGGLQAVIRALEELQPVEPVPAEASFAIGTARVPRDMLAQIHRDEAVIDARSMRVLRDYGIRVQASSSDASSKAVIDELRELRAERKAGDVQMREIAARIEALERAMRANAIAIERQTELMRRGFA